VLSQILYIAGPLHASVNYPQYPLGAYMPSVAATIYKRPPTEHVKVDEKSMLDWFPPRDVALYTLSFEYLLSSIQFDVFATTPRTGSIPTSRRRSWSRRSRTSTSRCTRPKSRSTRANRMRPMPYPYQLPSRIPNSISI
jgi:arachidonate 15-lipoxygenase